jgi:type 1 glutamine amidotransferase
MGHREEVWTNPTFQQILVDGIKWALGEVPPNIKEVAPGDYMNPFYSQSKSVNK